MDGNKQTLASNIGFFASSLIFFALRIYVRYDETYTTLSASTTDSV